MHTNLGDLKIELFCELIPKNAEVRSQYPEMKNRTSSRCVPAATTITASSTGTRIWMRCEAQKHEGVHYPGRRSHGYAVCVVSDEKALEREARASLEVVFQTSSIPAYALERVFPLIASSTVGE